jgi:hypothetical protein
MPKVFDGLLNDFKEQTLKPLAESLQALAQDFQKLNTTSFFIKLKELDCAPEFKGSLKSLYDLWGLHETAVLNSKLWSQVLPKL